MFGTGHDPVKVSYESEGTARLGRGRLHCPRPPYATFPTGSFLIRFPVRAKIALHTAGAMGGVPGSPAPPCASALGTMYTSITGISFMRSIR